MTYRLTSSLKFAMRYSRFVRPNRGLSERKTLLRLLLQIYLLAALGFDIVDYDVDFSVSDDAPAITALNVFIETCLDGPVELLSPCIEPVTLPSCAVYTPSDRAPPA